MSIEEAQNNTPEVCEPEPKHSKRPMTKKDYEGYEFVLSSAKTISDYKYLQASQAESDVLLTMLSKVDDVEITLHHDTTSENSKDGEWPSIMINFSGKQHFRLWPLFCAYEDRAQIARLIVELFEPLACAAWISMEREITSLQLWEQVDAFMTDSVAKKLGGGQNGAPNNWIKSYSLSYIVQKPHCWKVGQI